MIYLYNSITQNHLTQFYAVYNVYRLGIEDDLMSERAGFRMKVKGGE